MSATPQKRLFTVRTPGGTTSIAADRVVVDDGVLKFHNGTGLGHECVAAFAVWEQFTSVTTS